MTATTEQENKQFIELCSHLCLSHEVTDRAVIRKHNTAHKKLNSLCNAICSDPKLASEFFQNLMDNENIIVSCTAAGYALHKGVCVPQALACLRQISAGPDVNAACAASISILVWERGMKHSE